MKGNPAACHCTERLKRCTERRQGRQVTAALPLPPVVDATLSVGQPTTTVERVPRLRLSLEDALLLHCCLTSTAALKHWRSLPLARRL